MKTVWNILGFIFVILCLIYILTHPKFPAAMKAIFYSGLFMLSLFIIFMAGKK